jgi:Fe-S cluster assembly scaffold protein SufB
MLLFLATALLLYTAGVRCPMELSTYFRINAENTGQLKEH